MNNMSKVRELLAAKSQLDEQNSDDKKATEIEIAAAEEMEKLIRRGVFESRHGDKLNCIIDVILNNQSLRNFISETPCDELEIILDEAVDNQSFIDLFKFVNERSPRLSALRESKRKAEEKKREKAAKSKRKNEQPQLFNSTAGTKGVAGENV